MTPKQNKIIYRAIQTFGARNQQMQTIEELMELQKALFENVHRGTDNKDNIIEEVADVEIMLAQIKAIHGIKEEQLDSIKEYKTGRLAHTIDKYTKKTKGKAQARVQIDRITSNGR